MTQNNRRMNVYVISTSGYENSFLEVRKKLFHLISAMGMTSNGYELKNYALTPDNTITEDCLNNMRSADLFLIFLNERYGFIESGYSKSVTHIEIEQAMKSSKPYLIFADDVIMDTLDLTNECELSNAPQYFELLKDPNYREQIKLLKQIAASHTVIKYPHNDIYETLDLIQNKIIGLSSSLITDFVRKQREHINHYSEHVLNNTPTGKVPLLYKVQGNYGTKDISSFCTDNLSIGISTIVEGECGAGKSFCTTVAFVTFAENHYENASCGNCKIPIFLEFRSYKNKRFRAKTYVIQIYAELLGYTPPDFLIKKMLLQGFIVFGDALDEWRHSSSHDDLCAMIKSLGAPFMISMRTSTYNRISASISIGTLPYISVSVCGWLKKDLLKHAEACLNNKIHLDRLQHILESFEIISNQNISYYSPLIANMAIQYIADAEGTPAEKISVGELFRASTENCIKRELQKNEKAITPVELRKIHAFFSKVSLFVFSARYNGFDPSSLRDLYDYLSNENFQTDEFDIKNLLQTFFSTNRTSFFPKHMMIVYYYVAEEAVRQMLESDFSIFSTYYIPSEINRMMGDFCRQISVSNLNTVFEEVCKHLKTINDEESKLLLYYFIPRIADNTESLKKKIVEFLRDSLPEEKGLSRIAILNWLTQLGDTYAEEMYLNLIQNDQVFSEQNRGTYLVYQQDRPDKLYGFLDDDDDDEWQATALSFVEHFKSSKMRHQFIRRPDFATMISFIKNGKRVYPFFSNYFLNLSQEDLCNSSFQPQYISFLKQNNIDPKKRKVELKHLLKELQTEINSHSDN